MTSIRLKILKKNSCQRRQRNRNRVWQSHQWFWRGHNAARITHIAASIVNGIAVEYFLINKVPSFARRI